ncbi:MAG: hypothetical protein CL587_12325 [Alteromonadaceae bacterium]|nr:hypothetical protein [Alteromonadaceae bacterium]
MSRKKLFCFIYSKNSAKTEPARVRLSRKSRFKCVRDFGGYRESSKHAAGLSLSLSLNGKKAGKQIKHSGIYSR